MVVLSASNVNESPPTYSLDVSSWSVDHPRKVWPDQVGLTVETVTVYSLLFVVVENLLGAPVPPLASYVKVKV